MSMLSESRRKKQWSLDPRNKNWSDDCNTLGKKMMEKMGWQNGKGLGAKEQGLTENLKVCMKNNKLGVGASLKGMDTWTSHLDTYSQLLTELGTCHRQPEELSPTRHKDTMQETSPFSLEEKSKKSKKRVHYMKFAKGKDLSMRSANDMVCIFGKPSGTVVGDLSPPVSCISVEKEDELSQPAWCYLRI
uniref:PIN2 (TERF1) interacting telomerase inhibitor 1 n=1 Tax=Eptatretus burgeri TaxID=7764 RepID=A0A8C4Q766_EPTBU